MEAFSKPRTDSWKGIVIHSMGQYINGLYAPEFLKSINLSAHYFVNPDGETDDMVSLDRIAYHAGKSKWAGLSGLNKCFIGIEILLKGDYTYEKFVKAIKDPQSFTDSHYKSTALLCYSMQFQFPEIKHIVRHSEVSGPDVRSDPKVDPGEGFSMDRLLGIIEGFVLKEESDDTKN